jgi:hypothetical protein
VDADEEVADSVLVEVMEEVGERPCPTGPLATACAAARAGIANGEALWADMAEAARCDSAALPADEELWLALATGVAARPPEPAADLGVTEWLAAVAALTLWGPGTQADAESLAQLVCEADEKPDESGPLVAAFQPVVERWSALGALDATERLTALGWWGLPEAQRRAWSGEIR